MLLKPIKFIVLTAAGTLIVGGVLFGRDLFSYVTSSARSVRAAVAENVPIEFQLRRAKDLVSDIVPEMQANIRLIAQQEVEITSLKADIEQSQKNLGDERVRVAKLRDGLTSSNVSFAYGNVTYTRDQLKEDLARRFDCLKEAEVVLAGKERLLQNRERSLAAAIQALDRTRSQKALLESQIASLEGQHQLIKAASVGTNIELDRSKLAQSEKLIADIKKQLDVAERVLAHQSQFVQPISIDVVDEKELVKEVDEHLAASAAAPPAQTAQR
jgi:septal ring factor EnvC (AmiA/AmiB activator)